MGSYLSTPVREKCSDDFFGKLSYGSSSMQGWRSSQEDAHNCQVNFDPDTETSLFAVYDGHGGAEVAIYTARHFPSYLKSIYSYKNGELGKALEEAFVGFDATLVEEDVVKQLKDIAGIELNEDDDEEDVKNEAALLREEAVMPIEKLMQRYSVGKLCDSSSQSREEANNNGSQSVDPIFSNGVCQDGQCLKVDNAEIKLNGEPSKPNQCLSPNQEIPHCSKTDVNIEEDSEEDEDSDGDNWNSDNDSDDDDDDDEEEEEEEEEEGDSESFSISNLFKREDEDGFEPLGFGETPGADSGCTAVVALLRGHDLFVANAGDSRCVVCRGKTAVDMSVDHKPEDDIERNRIQKAGGKISADGRVNGGLNLSRAIGDHAYKQNRNLELRDQMITSLPDIKHITLGGDDKFMVLACDGIWNVLTSQEVVDFILKRIEMGETKLSNICEELFETCLAPDTSGDGTGCDNMTCIIVKFPLVSNISLNETKNSKRSHESEDGDENLAKRCRNDFLDCESQQCNDGQE